MNIADESNAAPIFRFQQFFPPAHYLRLYNIIFYLYSTSAEQYNKNIVPKRNNFKLMKNFGGAKQKIKC